jgi:hypothetical protein
VTDLKDKITRKDVVWIIIWVAGILFLYVLGGIFGAGILRDYKVDTQKIRQAWIESTTMDLGETQVELNAIPGKEPTEVTVGIRINRIGTFSLRESIWKADFDIWFNWTGTGVRPGENFQIVNGEIENQEKEEEFTLGDMHYERYNVRANLAIGLDASRFPFSDQGLTIQVEDRADGAENLRYIPDETDSGISSLGIPSGFEITQTLAAVKLYGHHSRRGDSRLPEGRADVHSRFVLALLVAPPGAGLFFKLFQALFASIAIAFVVFFIKPIHVDPRFGLGIGAFFASVGNNIYIGSILPHSSQISLASMINGIGLLTIFFTLVQSTISLHLFDTRGREKLSRFFDHMSFAAFLIGYLAVNLTLPLIART